MSLAWPSCETLRRRTASLRVAADPNNLPFSNERGEGFENKIAQLIGQELHAKIEYTWRAQRRGFFRETLKQGDERPGARGPGALRHGPDDARRITGRPTFSCRAKIAPAKHHVAGRSAISAPENRRSDDRQRRHRIRRRPTRWPAAAWSTTCRDTHCTAITRSRIRRRGSWRRLRPARSTWPSCGDRSPDILRKRSRTPLVMTPVSAGDRRPLRFAFDVCYGREEK